MGVLLRSVLTNAAAAQKGCWESFERGACHWKCSDRVTTGRTGRLETQSADRGLSGVTCGVCEENREFQKADSDYFKSLTTRVRKTSAVAHGTRHRETGAPTPPAVALRTVSLLKGMSDRQNIELTGRFSRGEQTALPNFYQREPIL